MEDAERDDAAETTPRDASNAPGNPVAVGRILRAHSLHGEVVVQPFTSAPGEIFAPGRRLSGALAAEPPLVDPRELVVSTGVPFQRGFRVKFEGVGDRTAAESLRGRTLFADASEIPEPEVDDVPVEDLIGLRAERSSGEVLGTIMAWYDVRQGILIEVAREGGSVLIPFHEDFVREVDVSGGKVVVDPPEGLL